MHFTIILTILSSLSFGTQSELVFEMAKFNTKLDVQHYEQVFAADVLECSNLCEDESNCQSINYILSTQQCQLLNHSDIYSENKLVGLAGVIYMKNILHRCFTEKPYACQHGECFGMPENQFRCICDPGYYTSKCENAINECLSNPCMNDGDCQDGLNYYTCTCTSQYMGDQCEVPCNLPLGMENGEITNSQLKGNNWHHGSSSRARLNNANFWAGRSSGNTYIRIILNQLTRLSMIAIQGAPSEDEWVTEFQLYFNVVNNGYWKSYKYEGVTQTFPGNTDRNSIVTNILPLALEALVLKIVPRACHNYCAMRLELYGCIP